MRVKPGVDLSALQPPMALASLVVESVYRRGGYDAEITSGCEGVHSGRPVRGGTRDPHYEGKALDFSIHDVLSTERAGLVDALKVCLGGLPFVVLWESQGTDNEHVHIQMGTVT